MNWKGIILDNMGYFSLYDIPNLFLAILAAALLVYLSAKFGLRVRTAELSALMALSATVALGVGLVKGQLVFAVILAAILIVAKGSVPKEISGGGLLLAMVILIARHLPVLITLAGSAIAWPAFLWHAW